MSELLIRSPIKDGNCFSWVDFGSMLSTLLFILLKRWNYKCSHAHTNCPLTYIFHSCDTDYSFVTRSHTRPDIDVMYVHFFMIFFIDVMNVNTEYSKVEDSHQVRWEKFYFVIGKWPMIQNINARIFNVYQCLPFTNQGFRKLGVFLGVYFVSEGVVYQMKTALILSILIYIYCAYVINYIL